MIKKTKALKYPHGNDAKYIESLEEKIVVASATKNKSMLRKAVKESVNSAYNFGLISGKATMMLQFLSGSFEKRPVKAPKRKPRK
jgi:hypothetical protein